MGACFISVTFPYCTETELRERFAKLQGDEQEQFGWDPYSGSWATIDYLGIDSKRTFVSEKEACAALEDLEKRSACAVVLLQQSPDAKATKRADALLAQAEKMRRERLYPLTGQRAFEYGIVSRPTWKDDLDARVIARVQSLAARTKGCRHCGSSIAVARIRSTSCPVCGEEYLMTDGERRRREALRQRIDNVQAEIDAVDLEARRVREERIRSGGQRVWYIGGWASM